MSHISFLKKPIARESSKSDAPFRPNWLNIAFIVPTHLVGLLGWPLYLYWGGNIQWQEVSVALFMFGFGVLGINVGYHRALSHLSFKMHPLLKVFTLMGGASTMEGSVLTWCSDHRRHHKYEDTDRDPYNINRGFWWAHMGWILGGPTSTDFSNVPDLMKDPWIRNQYKYQGLWIIGMAFGLPLFLGFILGRPLECFLLGGLTRLFVLNHFTYMINSYAHYFGKRPYSTDITARDSLLCALMAQGEGWHNFHHRFPFDYRNGHRWYHYDPAKWMILIAQRLGLASHLKETPAVEIYRARMQVQFSKYPELMNSKNPHLLSATEALQVAFEKWHQESREWETAWKHLKSQWTQEQSRRVAALRSKMRMANKDFQKQYEQWRRSIEASRTFLAPVKTG